MSTGAKLALAIIIIIAVLMLVGMVVQGLIAKSIIGGIASVGKEIVGGEGGNSTYVARRAPRYNAFMSPCRA